MKTYNLILPATLLVSLMTAAQPTPSSKLPFDGQARPIAGPELPPDVSPVRATLVLPDADTLPGVPLEMWVEIENESDTKVGLGLCATMLVQPQGGRPFEVNAGPGAELGRSFPVLLPVRHWRGDAVWYVELTPHQRMTLTLPVERDLQRPTFFSNDGILLPGVYEIALRLDYCWNGSTPQRSLVPATFMGSVTTNTVTLRRRVTTDQDLAVWERIKAAAGKERLGVSVWQNTNIASDILANYKDSSYFPYAVLVASRARSDFEDAARRFPQTPVSEMLYEQIASHTGWPGSESAKARMQTSRRPTTRIRVFGREDVGPEPCPSEVDACKH